MAQREKVASAEALNEAHARRSAERAAFALREKLSLVKEENLALQRRLGAVLICCPQPASLPQTVPYPHPGPYPGPWT